jgi:2-methylfumaryl-CoA hydratase
VSDSSEASRVEIGGPWFEDFAVGQEYDAPAVTLTQGHASLFQALSGDRLRLPLDHYASRLVTGRTEPLAHPLLVINMAIGQSTWASQRVKANLFYRGLVLHRPVHLGDTLHTVTRVVALRQNRTQAGRPATGVAALEMTTRNQHGDEVLHFWRCPMIPCRDAEAATSHGDDLAQVGQDIDVDTLNRSVPDWALADAARDWQGLRAQALDAGTVYSIEARDTITSAPELVRVTLNMAMAHTDARLSYLGDRLVYGGHTISLAFAQVTRALPNLVTMIAWESCDHTAPVVESDRLRTDVTVLEKRPLDEGTLLKLRVDTWAARGDPEAEERVLDWRFWAWSA